MKPVLVFPGWMVDRKGKSDVAGIGIASVIQSTAIRMPMHAVDHASRDIPGAMGANAQMLTTITASTHPLRWRKP